MKNYFISVSCQGNISHLHWSIFFLIFIYFIFTLPSNGSILNSNSILSIGFLFYLKNKILSL